MTDHDIVDATLASTLDSLDDAVNYRAWIVDLARPHLRTPILEIGAGHGTFTESLARFGPIHALEPGVRPARILRERFIDHPDVSVQQGTVDDVSVREPFGSAIMVNVLEHIEDDADALRQIRGRLDDTGTLILWVPAFMLLFSEFDTKLGHHRRYRRPQLVDLVTNAGYDVIDARYVNLPGWFSWFVITRVLGQEPTAGPLVRLFDKIVVPVVRRLETLVDGVPFGQSIFLVARKTDGGESTVTVGSEDSGNSRRPGVRRFAPSRRRRRTS